jgi:hypothetical protein
MTDRLLYPRPGNRAGVGGGNAGQPASDTAYLNTGTVSPEGGYTPPESGGVIVEDGSGTAYPSEPIIQFLDSTVTDDPTHTRTVVDINVNTKSAILAGNPTLSSGQVQWGAGDISEDNIGINFGIGINLPFGVYVITSTARTMILASNPTATDLLTINHQLDVAADFGTYDCSSFMTLPFSVINAGVGTTFLPSVTNQPFGLTTDPNNLIDFYFAYDITTAAYLSITQVIDAKLTITQIQG